MTNHTLIQEIQKDFITRTYPQFSSGMEVEVYQNIEEWGKIRTQKFKGIIIKVSGKSDLEKTITVRKKNGAYGIEKVFFIHSPTVQNIIITKTFKVRRKNILFLRNLSWKKARLKEKK